MSALKSALVSVIDGAAIVSVALSSLLIVPVAVGVLVMAAACVAVVPVIVPRSDRERLVGLDHRVALDRHRHVVRLARRAGEVQRGRVQRVVRAVGRAVAG